MFLYILDIIESAIFTAIVYTVAVKCPLICMGNTLASTTLTLSPVLLHPLHRKVLAG
jgi:hypothetical protein